MQTYCYLDLVSNEVGRAHRVVGHLQAGSVEEAERICEANGLEYDGKLVETIPAPKLNKLCEDVQEEWDRNWVGK